MYNIDNKNKRNTGVLLFAVLIVGVFLAWWLIRQADGRMRSDHLHRTRLLAMAINIEHIKALSGTMADLNLPEYLRLKEQLAAARTIFPKSRFLYLMGRKSDGSVFFYADSEPVGSKDESPAGQVYEEISVKYLHAFETRIETTVGPETDRWGTWISALVPLIDPKTGDLVAVMGIDIDAAGWRWEVCIAGLLPLLMSLALSGIILIGHVLIAKRVRLSGEYARRFRYLEALLLSAVGITLTLSAAWIAHDIELRNRFKTFFHLASSEAAHVVEAVRDLRDIELEGLARFYENTTNKHVDAESFEKFTQYLSENSAVQAWEWIPAVSEQEKHHFLEIMRKAGLTEFEIWQMDAVGNKAAATGRPFYFPVTRVNPLDGNERVVGYDLGSEPLRRAALQKAAHSGLITGTDPITLVQETGSQKGILVYRPVFKPDKAKSLKGFALAVLRLETLLKSAVGPAPSLSIPPIIVCLYQLQADHSAELLATTTDGEHNTFHTTSLFIFNQPVFAFGKTYSVAVSCASGFEDLYPVKSGWIALLTGLLMTTVIAFLKDAFVITCSSG